METILAPHTFSSLFNFKQQQHIPKTNSITLTNTKTTISCNLKKDTIFKSLVPTNTNWLTNGLAALAISLALNFTPVLANNGSAAFASEFNVLNDGPPKESYVVDDAGVLSRVTRADLKNLLSDLEYRKKIRINFVTVRKLTSKADAFEYADQVLERWYPTLEEGNNKGIVVLVTSQKEGAVTGGPEFIKAVGDTVLDATVSQNLPDMTKESGDTSKKEVSTTSTPQFQCPILKPSNYSLWAIRMQIILEANGLWEMIEPNEKTQADNKKDKTAIAFLYQALPEEQLLQITKHKTAKTIWDALKTRHIGEERVQQARELAPKCPKDKTKRAINLVEEDVKNLLMAIFRECKNKRKEQGSKAYRLFDPTTQRVCVSRNVKFKEDETWDWKDYMSKHINDEPEWTNFKIGNLEVTNEHHDQETQPIEDDNESS
ncbi:UPF0603 protein, chloroplastic [Tanacetum coccineum]|uniref:UPF0603 protein, chloroplastic n=1 Tax=Tanacetum coccineum TaxID=301880 RepID=A0ABQ5DSK2_9ASTR